MSLHETPLTLWYWDQIGGTLIEEFQIVPAGPNQGRRLIDAIIILGTEKQRLPTGATLDLDGKDIIVVQTKNSRLGMYLMGQTLFSAQLIQRYFSPRSLQSIALCTQSDQVLQPLLEAYDGCKVICPPANYFRQ